MIEELALKSKYDTSSRTKIKLTNDVKNEIENLILKNEKNKSLGRAKQLMKKIDIHEYLIEKSYDISYSTVCNYTKDTYDKKETFIRQEYQLGETVEFDWGEVKLEIGGKSLSLYMGLFTTANGSFHYSKLYHNQKTENFLDMHVEFFNFIEGNHKEVVYDNMKQAVKRFVGKTEKEATDHLISIALYYGFKYRFCNTRCGNEKGHVERGVEFIRRKAFPIKTDFNSLE
ncbi:transposase [Senegalia massiliensis]|uniref:Transposase n=1 Tax=Senegalia massiliensis TaxID=1720316 RepID=A0A845QXS0_9CLOT|nr:transposase [Senegalia massiliensis]NBI07767.1 transposase [Senegalia massiliensis]